MKFKTLINILFLFTLTACTTEKGIGNKTGDSSMTSLDWAGVYAGTLPCTDCDGIRYMITLGENLTFILRTKYLSKSDSVFESSGTFTWSDEGNKITLNERGADKKPVMYLVGENLLVQLDLTGNRIDGELAEKYTFKKIDGDISGKYWKLMELYGRAIIIGKSYRLVPHFIFNKDGTFTGHGACNIFSGGYKLTEGNLILSGAAVTEIACPDYQLERDMLNMLNEITSYKVEGDRLYLFETRNNIIAQLVVDYLEYDY